MICHTLLGPLLCFVFFGSSFVYSNCTIPILLRNTWFSIEDGKQTVTDINASEMTGKSGKGVCVTIEDDFRVNTMVFQNHNCYYCVKLLIRTVNALEKIETPCVDLEPNEEPTVERVCQGLNSNQNSTTLFSENHVPAEVAGPGCRLPQNFSGDWINTANIDADVFINKTHIIETFYDESRERRTIYVCREHVLTDNRVLMAQITDDEYPTNYVCFNFVQQHHNVIRYRKGLAMVHSNFDTVCSWDQFKKKQEWHYNTLLKKNPSPIRCPVAGKFNFTQRGDFKFEARILRENTLTRRPNRFCALSDLSICDKDQTTMKIKENHCPSIDYLGIPMDYSDPDYTMKCIGFWKENHKSYLITYDELDLFSKYRCWVYQRDGSNRIRMSQALGSFCDLKQEVTSCNYTEGAAVAIELEEYGGDSDRCPVDFYDGSDPWAVRTKPVRKPAYSYWISNHETEITEIKR